MILPSFVRRGLRGGRSLNFQKTPNKWNITPKEAIKLQKKLASTVKIIKPRRKIRYVAGVDMALSPDGQSCIAAAVLWDKVKQVIVEKQTSLKKLTFPYVPGLLSFREAPAVLGALRKLKGRTDAIICDGHGLAHPRRFGIACHIGVIVGLPTLGCGKSRLIGDYKEPGLKRGSRSIIKHKGEIIGTLLRTRDNVKPVFVSVGHKIDLETAVKVVIDCGTGYRLPEPTRQADHLAAVTKKKLWSKKNIP